MPGITSRALPSPTSTGRASIIRSVASILAFSMSMVVLLSVILGVFATLWSLGRVPAPASNNPFWDIPKQVIYYTLLT
jgi:hypothetical protein